MSTIDADHFPLGFKVSDRQTDSAFLAGHEGHETFKVEARQMHGHQKEALLTEGETGTVWRLTSDEGLHLKGTDLAPFPLGFFNAGIQGEIINTIVCTAQQQSIELERIELKLVNHYWLTGSFVLGTGQGHSEPTDIDIQIQSQAPQDKVAAVVKAALEKTAPLNLLRNPLVNTFAIYLNGVRRKVVNLHDSPPAPVADPFLVHTKAPRPLKAAIDSSVIEKLNTLVEGDLQMAPTGTTSKIIRDVFGESVWSAGQKFSTANSWLGVPGTTHFAYRMDVGGAGHFPTGVGLISAGITFCFMTQLSRYIENMKMAIDGIRVVQHSPYARDELSAKALPIDTHLFLNGSATEEVCTQLLSIAERTCYLHVTASKELQPLIGVKLNGYPMSL
jgi:uncharacterized OsmC-like protein